MSFATMILYLIHSWPWKVLPDILLHETVEKTMLLGQQKLLDMYTAVLTGA